MNAVDYLKAKGRLCKQYRCGRCPLRAYDTIGSRGYQAEFSCIDLERESPEQAVEAVEKWAKENPAKTYLSVLLKKLPNTKLFEGSFAKFCPNTVFNTNEKCPSHNKNCKDCWNREYREYSEE